MESSILTQVAHSASTKDFVDDLRSKPSKLCRTHFTLMPDDVSRKKKGDLLLVNEKELDLKALGEAGIKFFWSVGEKTSMSEDKFYLKTKYNYVVPKGSIIFGEKMSETVNENGMLEKFNETLECFKLWVEGGFKRRFVRKENERLAAHIKQQKAKEIRLYFLAINIFNMDSIKVPDKLIQVSQKGLQDCLKKKRIIKIGEYKFLIDVAFVYVQNSSSLPQKKEILYATSLDEQRAKSSKTQPENSGAQVMQRNENFEKHEVESIFDSKNPSSISLQSVKSPRRVSTNKPDQKPHQNSQPPQPHNYQPMQFIPPPPPPHKFPMFYGPQPPCQYPMPYGPQYPLQKQMLYRPQFPQHPQYFQPPPMFHPQNVIQSVVGFSPIQSPQYQQQPQTFMKKER